MSRTMEKGSPRRPPLDPAVAAFVWQRAGGRCEWCGLSLEAARKYGGSLQLAHVKPWAEWREDRDDPENIQLLCTFRKVSRGKGHPQGIAKGHGCHGSLDRVDQAGWASREELPRSYWRRRGRTVHAHPVWLFLGQGFLLWFFVVAPWWWYARWHQAPPAGDIFAEFELMFVATCALTVLARGVWRWGIPIAWAGVRLLAHWSRIGIGTAARTTWTALQRRREDRRKEDRR